MHKVLTVFGTRPEAIKLAPVIKRLESCSDLGCEVCVTAQHRQMLDQVLDIFGVEPDYDLDIMRPNQDLFDITTKALSKLKAVMKQSRPALVLVQGDTTTTLAASLAAYYLRIPVGHVEAGLRTNNKYSPFPEEVNRRVATVIADLNFAPTSWAERNLLREGVSKEKIFVTGNTVIDALCHVVNIISSRPVGDRLETEFGFLRGGKKVVLITGHRRESFGDGFRNICNAIKQLAETLPAYDFVYPVHLNPHVRAPVEDILGRSTLCNLHLIEPVEYLSFAYLMKRAYLILTDSGGIQEEAISFGKPVLVMRNTTERPEGIEAGAVKLIGTGQSRIFGECNELLTNESKYNSMVEKKNPYGDGKAAERIIDILRQAVPVVKPYGAGTRLTVFPMVSGGDNQPVIEPLQTKKHRPKIRGTAQLHQA
jgi:UDP-N-acetylglucosamine 2-epimerase (non-hydrolysing)